MPLRDYQTVIAAWVLEVARTAVAACVFTSRSQRWTMRRGLGR